ncbi:MAG: exonuclease domain-containing protein [Defluviitaleaceae bacterium]|nr:exonuclease domain-containing protein [Defluviitaleaceae bacterium]
MDYIVMDLEFNQPFDFEDGEGAVAEPECPFEIVQVGLVKLCADFVVRDTLELNIRPSIYERIHPFVGKITGLTYDDIHVGTRSFPNNFGDICNFIGSSENIFAVWGGSDIKLLFKNICYHKLPMGGIPTNFIDVQALASRKLSTTSGTSIGLKNAVTALEIEQDRPFHNALSDALYTARIFDIVCKGEASLEKYVKGFRADSLSSSKRGCRDGEYDAVALHREAEKMFGRKLTATQKKIVRKIYEMGLGGRFN